MSLAASGSVAKTLTYAHWKGRPYVRQLVTPSNPRSTAQYFTRAMMAFLARAWAHMEAFSSGSQATWQDLAKQGNFSPFNAFVKTNMMRWTQLQGPILMATGAGSNTDNTITAFTATAGVRQIAISFHDAANNAGWDYSIVLDPANGATPPITLTRLIMQNETPGVAATLTGQMSGLDPGTYSVALYQGHIDGSISAIANATQGLVVT